MRASRCHNHVLIPFNSIHFLCIFCKWNRWKLTKTFLIRRLYDVSDISKIFYSWAIILLYTSWCTFKNRMLMSYSAIQRYNRFLVELILSALLIHWKINKFLNAIIFFSWVFFCMCASPNFYRQPFFFV